MKRISQRIKRVNPTIENNHTGRRLDSYRSQDKWLDLFIVGIILLLIGLVFAFIMTTEKFIPAYNQVRTAQSDMNARIGQLDADVIRISEAVESWPGITETTVIETEPAKAAVTETTEAETANMKLIGTFKVTAYCPCPKCCGKWSGQKMWNGRYPEEGRTVGADYDVLPRGTRIYVESVGERVVEDTGSYTGNRLDLFFSDHQEALNWTAPNGHHDLKVWIVE
jgi:3D (Asp-Asp-Asp) domain-containing protein